MRLIGAVAAGMLVLPLLHGSAATAAGRNKASKPAVASETRAAPMTFSGACASGDHVTIAGVGDLLFHESLQRQALTPSSSYKRFFPGIEAVLKGADITYGNLEGPAAHAVAAGGGNVKDPGRTMDGRVYGTVPGALIFNYHPSVVPDLKTVGFKVVSTANNHAADRGALGIDRTVEALEANGLAFTGTRKRTAKPGELAGGWTTVTEAKGLRIAWLACSYGTNGMPDRHNQVLLCYRDRATVMAELVKAAADPAIDAVILTPHWGQEGSATPLKSDRVFARDAIEAGATAIIGAHPHVLQPWERIETASGRDALVVYSTGNFISNQVSSAQRSGVVALIDLVKPTGGGKALISAVGFVPTWVEKSGGHRVLEMSSQGGEIGAALKATLRLLPAGNRVAAKDFRTLPRPHCPQPAPEATPAESQVVASAGSITLPAMKLAVSAPDVTPFPVGQRSPTLPPSPLAVATLLPTPEIALPKAAPSIASVPPIAADAVLSAMLPPLRLSSAAPMVNAPAAAAADDPMRADHGPGDAAQGPVAVAALPALPHLPLLAEITFVALVAAPAAPGTPRLPGRPAPTTERALQGRSNRRADDTDEAWSAFCDADKMRYKVTRGTTGQSPRAVPVVAQVTPTERRSKRGSGRGKKNGRRSSRR